MLISFIHLIHQPSSLLIVPGAERGFSGQSMAAAVCKPGLMGSIKPDLAAPGAVPLFCDGLAQS